MTFEEAKLKGGMKDGMRRESWVGSAFVVGKPVRRVEAGVMSIKMIDGKRFLNLVPIGIPEGYLSVGDLGYDRLYVPRKEDLEAEDWEVGQRG